MSDSTSRTTKIGVVFLQSILAAIAWFVFVVVILYVTGDTMDSEKHRFQHHVMSDIWGTFIMFAFPLACATLAPILIWRKPHAGWWLAVTLDVITACIGFGTFRSDLQRMFHDRLLFRFVSGAFDFDAVYHVALIVIPITALCLLFSRSMRAHAS